jgi:hypothetical protein
MPTVDSSAVARVEYTGATKALDVWFRDGSHYTYFDVPLDQYQAMLTAPSIPVFLESTIKGQYHFAEEPRKR